MAKYDALYFESQRKKPMLISDTTIDKELRRSILKTIEEMDIEMLKRIVYEVRCEEVGIFPDATYMGAYASLQSNY